MEMQVIPDRGQADASPSFDHRATRSPRDGGEGFACNHDEIHLRDELLVDTEALLKQIDPRIKRQVVYHEMTRHLYSSQNLGEGVVPASGAAATELLFAGIDPQYQLTNDEAMFFERNHNIIGPYVRELAGDRPITFVSLGCGPYSSVLLKDLGVTSAIGAKKYVAVDNSRPFARAAAACVKTHLKISTSDVGADFMKSFRLPKCVENTLVVFGIFGDTMGQFSTNPQDGHNGKSPLELFLNNISESANFKSPPLLLATLDNESHPPSLLMKYSGPGMRALMDTLWAGVKLKSGDRNFNPALIRYNPFHDPVRSSIRFAYEATDDTQVTFFNKTRIIPYGTTLIIGDSLKNGPEATLPTCQKAGWEKRPNAPAFSYNNTVRALLLQRGF